MDEKAAYDRIKAACYRRPDLRFKNWEPDLEDELTEFGASFMPMSGLVGYCYIATQVFCALIEDAVPYCADDRMHFWAQVGETVWDPTEDQFEVMYDYSLGRRTRFKTMSKRAEALLDEVLSDTSGWPSPLVNFL